jgi:hypothetical protein
MAEDRAGTAAADRSIAADPATGAAATQQQPPSPAG